MKRFLLVLLLLLLILLPSCNTEGNQNNDIPPKGNSSYSTIELLTEDIKEFKDFFETHPNDDSQIIDTSNVEGNIKIESAFIPSGTFILSDYIDEIDGNTKELLIVDEKDIFQNKKDEFVYLFFYRAITPYPDNFPKINSANLENGVISLNIDRECVGSQDIIPSVLFVIKIDKSSLFEAIIDLSVKFEYIYPQENKN